MFKSIAARTGRLSISTWQGSRCVNHFHRLASLVSLACVAIVLSSAVAHAQCISITSYGGNGNGTTNNSPALASAFAALTTRGGCIDFPAGRYLFSTAVTLTYPASGIYSVTLLGAGTDNTTLYWAAANGITINAHGAEQTIHVRDMTFSTGSAGGYSALTLNNSSPLGTIALSDVFRTIFRGDDGGDLTDYWTNGISVVGQSNINFDSDTFFGPSSANAGNGILLNGNTSESPYYGIVYNIAKCGFFWTGNGLVIGTYIQGISITQSNFTNGLTGIWGQPGGVGFDELAVTAGNQFNTTGNQIEIQQPIAHMIVNGNLFFVSGGNTGIFFDSTGQQHTIVNNVFNGTSSSGSNGIYVASSNANGVVTGNLFANLNVGVNLIGTSGWNVQANSYQSVTTDVANIGSNSVGIATK